MAGEKKRYKYLLLLTLAPALALAPRAHAYRCSPAGQTPVCSWTETCVPEERPGIEPPWDPLKPPPLPGTRVSCTHEFMNENDWTTSCVGGIDIEVRDCDVYFGGDDEPAANRIEFSVFNHSSVVAHSSKSARWGHIGQNPVAAPPAQVDNFPSNPDRDDLATFEADYPQYSPDNAMSESYPNPISFAPGTLSKFQHSFIHNYPPIKACGDLVYIYVTQEGTVEPPHLWNRNWGCQISPCQSRNFKICKVHRAGKNALHDAAKK